MIDTGTTVSINGTNLLTGLTKSQCLEIAFALSPELAALVEAAKSPGERAKITKALGAVLALLPGTSQRAEGRD